MRLHIEHTTTYVYARPVSFGRHRLVLRPREGHDLRVERMQLRLTPAASPRDGSATSSATRSRSSTGSSRPTPAPSSTTSSSSAWPPFPARAVPRSVAGAVSAAIRSARGRDHRRLSSRPSYPDDVHRAPRLARGGARQMTRWTPRERCMALCERVGTHGRLSAPAGEGRAEPGADADAEDADRAATWRR